MRRPEAVLSSWCLMESQQWRALVAAAAVPRSPNVLPALVSVQSLLSERLLRAEEVGCRF